MTLVKLIPLLTMALLFGVIVAENRFGYRSPSSARVVLRDGAAQWKRAAVKWNDHIRYGGMFLFWGGSSAFAVQVRRQPGEESLLLLGVAGVGVLLYLIALGWRVYVTKSDLVV
jgi:hypothetical protein